MIRTLFLVVFATMALAACSEDPPPPTGRWPCPVGWVPGDLGGCGPAVLLCVPDGGAAPGACNGVDITQPGTIALPDGGTVPGFYRLSDGGIGGAWPEPGDPAVGIRTCPDGWSRSSDGTCDPQLRTDCPEASGPLPGGRCTPTSERDCPTTEYADLGTEAMGARVLHVRAGADAASADGSEAHPFPTIARALEVVGDEVWVRVARGEYAESVSMRFGRVHLVGVCAARVTLRGDGDHAGLEVTGPSALLDLRGVTVTGASPGLHSSAGRLQARAVRVLGNNLIGVRADGQDARVDLDGCTVQDTARRSGGTSGRGLEVERGAYLHATGVLVADNTEAGIVTFHTGTRVELENSVVRDTRPQPDGRSGEGLEVHTGSYLHATGVLVAGNMEGGISAVDTGTRVEMDGCVVRDNRPRADGSFGYGLSVGIGASLHATNLLVASNTNVGVLVVGAETRVELDGCVVRDTRSAAHGVIGFGLEVDTGAFLRATGGLVAGNTGAGVLVSDAETRVELDGCVVRDTRSGPDRLSGPGVGVTTGAFLHARNVLVTRSTAAGVAVRDMGTQVELEGCAVRDTQTTRNGDFGRGLDVFGGVSLHASGVLVSHDMEIGMIFSGTAQATLTDVIADDVIPSVRGFGVGLYVTDAEVRGARVAVRHVAGAGVAALPDPAMSGSAPARVHLDDVFVRDVSPSTIRFNEDNMTLTPEGAMVAYGLHAVGGASLEVTRALVDAGSYGVADVGSTIRLDTGVIARQSVSASLFSDHPPGLVNVAYRANRALSVNDPQALAAASLPPSQSICETGMCP